LEKVADGTFTLSQAYDFRRLRKLLDGQVLDYLAGCNDEVLERCMDDGGEWSESMEDDEEECVSPPWEEDNAPADECDCCPLDPETIDLVYEVAEWWKKGQDLRMPMLPERQSIAVAIDRHLLDLISAVANQVGRTLHEQIHRDLHNYYEGD